MNLTVYTGSTAWGRKQILNIAKYDQKAGLEMALRFDKLTLLYYSGRDTFVSQANVSFPEALG